MVGRNQYEIPADRPSARLPLRHRNQLFLIIGVLAVLVLVMLAPISPRFTTVPTRDPGVFLYIGRQILDGKIPYRDVWDHKPPLIFFINALGQLITRNSFWGIWILEVGWLLTSGVLGFLLLNKAFGYAAATTGSTIWIVQLGQLLAIEGGNFTEEFALLFQFAALYLFWQMEKEGKSPLRRSLLIGLCAGSAFFLKQNLIGLWVAMGLYLALAGSQRTQWRARLTQIAGIALGATGVAAGFLLFFYWTHALSSFWDAAFEYNFNYVETTESMAARISAVFLSIGQLTLSGIMVVASAGWILGFLRLHHTGKRAHFVHQHPLLTLALIDFLIEPALLSLSGRTYSHYLIPWLPALSICTAFFVQQIQQFDRIVSLRKTPPGQVVRPFLAILVGSILIVMPVSTGYLFRSRIIADEYEQSQTSVAEYIVQNTAPNEYVLLWGAETQLHYITQRDTPTRYVYQYPLYTDDYQDLAIVREFLADLQGNPPALIIDASFNTGRVPPIDPDLREHWVAPWDATYEPLPAIDIIYSYILAHYQQIAPIPGFEGDVYQRRFDDNLSPNASLVPREPEIVG